jgi:hypothetical protein
VCVFNVEKEYVNHWMKRFRFIWKITDMCEVESTLNLHYRSSLHRTLNRNTKTTTKRPLKTSLVNLTLHTYPSPLHPLQLPPITTQTQTQTRTQTRIRTRTQIQTLPPPLLITIYSNDNVQTERFQTCSIFLLISVFLDDK